MIKDIFVDFLVDTLLRYLDGHGNGSAQHCNLREHLHYYQGCKECVAAWHKGETHEKD